ncbi:MAG: heparinase II/III domain-containing protein [Limnochordia bacterium]
MNFHVLAMFSLIFVIVISGATLIYGQTAEARLPLAKHPRLVADNTEFERLKERMENDPVLESWYSKIRAAGDNLLYIDPVEYLLPDGVRLLTTSREVLSRIYTLGFLYRATGEQKYVDRAWLELQAVASFPDWNPSHFLDTAEMTHAFAIGYDWLYDAWDDAKRQYIADIIVQKGLQPALDAYRHSAWWVNDISNWNVVCNSGVALGAIALADEYPELASTIMERALGSIRFFLDRLDGFEGAWDEGLHYWNYSMEYLVAYLATLNTAFGTDYGLTDRIGVEEAGTYPIYISGPTGLAFHYGDGTIREPNLPVMYWFGERFNRPEYVRWQSQSLADLSGVNERLHRSVWNLLWYSEEQDSSLLPLDRYYPGLEVITFRSAWQDPEALFVGFKGGDNAAPHGDLDLGTFVLDALGVRWAIELGSDDYNLPGYFDQDKTGRKLGGQRWNYYRKRAEGQNTLVLNPSPYIDQDSRAKAAIAFYDTKPDQALAVADLSKAYNLYGKNVSVMRGVALFDRRRQVIIQDEITNDIESTVWWFMHTAQQISISSDGKLATLSNNNKRLEVRILSPSNAELMVMDAKPLSSSPNPSGQNPNQGIRKLAIKVSGVKKLRLTVLLTPLSEGESIGQVPEVLPLAQWLEAGGSEVPLWGGTQPRLKLDIDCPYKGMKSHGYLPLDIVADGLDTVDIKNVTVRLNNDIVYRGGSLPVAKSIDTTQYEDGQYQLTVQLTTADNLCFSSSVQFEIKNRWVLIDDMKAPVDAGILGTINLSKASMESEGWAYTNKPENIFGDDSRRIGTSGSSEHIIWEAPQLKEYLVTMYSREDFREDAITLYVSSDKVNWEELDYTVTTISSSNGWTEYKLEGQAIASSNWFKLVLDGMSTPNESLQIGAVKLVGLVMVE